MTMATTLDLPKFYSQARVQFAVRHKTSGQLLGYALLLAEPDEDSLVKLVPWDDDDLHTTDAALAASRDNSPFSHSSLPSSLNQNLNMSSENEESSLNNTLTSQCASDMPASQDDFNASVSLSKLSSSTPEQMPSMSSPVSSGFSSAKSVSSSKIGLSSGKSSSSLTLPTVPSSVSEDIVGKCSGIQEENPTDCSGPKRKYSDMNGGDSECKSKTIKLDENENPRVGFGINFLPGAVRRYDLFIEDINPGLKLKDNKLKKVKCLLCGDGKLLSYGNMRRHIKRYHEPPATCQICQREFNALQMEKHRIRCHKEKLKEKNSDIRKSDVNKLNVKSRRQEVSPSKPSLKPSTEVINNSSTPTANSPVQAGSANEILPVKLDQPNSLTSSDGSSSDCALQPSSQGQANLSAGDY